jgi:hypothetical protein
VLRFPLCAIGTSLPLDGGQTVKQTLPVVVIAALALGPVTGPLQAQGVLGTAFKKKYALKSVACVVCHIKTEAEDEHPLNDLGVTLAQRLEGRNVTQRLDAAENADETAQDKVKEEVQKEFLDVLKELDAIKAPSGKTYPDALRAGEIEGAKPRK